MFAVSFSNNFVALREKICNSPNLFQLLFWHTYIHKSTDNYNNGSFITRARISGIYYNINLTKITLTQLEYNTTYA